jgi:hypothetical protein
VTPEERELALQILDAFRDNVEQAGAGFLVFYLPKRHELRTLQSGGAVANADFLQELAKRFEFLSTADALLQEAQRTTVGELYQPGGHYSPAGNMIVGRVLAERVSTARRAAR